MRDDDDGSVLPAFGRGPLASLSVGRAPPSLVASWVGPGQPQFRQVLRTQGLALSNTKNVPLLSVAGGYFGTSQEDQATTSEGQRWKVRLLSVLFCFCFGHATVVCRILVPLLGIELQPPAVEGWSPNHLTTTGSPPLCAFKTQLCFTGRGLIFFLWSSLAPTQGRVSVDWSACGEEGSNSCAGWGGRCCPVSSPPPLQEPVSSTFRSITHLVGGIKLGTSGGIDGTVVILRVKGLHED